VVFLGFVFLGFENATYYITGFIARKLNPKFPCDECRKLLLTSAEPGEATLISIKNIHGDLVYPSEDLANLCYLGEQVFTFFEQAEFNMINKNVNILENLISAAKTNNHASSFSNHSLLNQEGVFDEEFGSHGSMLCELILKEYFTIRLHHYGKLMRNQLIKQNIRGKNIKAVHNKGC
jgi:hypothetical protein